MWELYAIYWIYHKDEECDFDMIIVFRSRINEDDTFAVLMIKEPTIEGLTRIESESNMDS